MSIPPVRPISPNASFPEAAQPLGMSPVDPAAASNATRPSSPSSTSNEAISQSVHNPLQNIQQLQRARATLQGRTIAPISTNWLSSLMERISSAFQKLFSCFTSKKSPSEDALAENEPLIGKSGITSTDELDSANSSSNEEDDSREEAAAAGAPKIEATRLERTVVKPPASLLIKTRPPAFQLTGVVTELDKLIKVYNKSDVEFAQVLMKHRGVLANEPSWPRPQSASVPQKKTPRTGLFKPQVPENGQVEGKKSSEPWNPELDYDPDFQAARAAAKKAATKGNGSKVDTVLLGQFNQLKANMIGIGRIHDYNIPQLVLYYDEYLNLDKKALLNPQLKLIHTEIESILRTKAVVYKKLLNDFIESSTTSPSDKSLCKRYLKEFAIVAAGSSWRSERGFGPTEVKPGGMPNIGNTCYFNSSIQALTAFPQLVVKINQPIIDLKKADSPAEKKLLEEEAGKALNNFMDALENEQPQAIIDELRKALSTAILSVDSGDFEDVEKRLIAQAENKQKKQIDAKNESLYAHLEEIYKILTKQGNATLRKLAETYQKNTPEYSLCDSLGGALLNSLRKMSVIEQKNLGHVTDIEKALEKFLVAFQPKGPVSETNAAALADSVKLVNVEQIKGLIVQLRPLCKDLDKLRSVVVPAKRHIRESTGKFRRELIRRALANVIDSKVKNPGSADATKDMRERVEKFLRLVYTTPDFNTDLRGVENLYSQQDAQALIQTVLGSILEWNIPAKTIRTQIVTDPSIQPVSRSKEEPLHGIITIPLDKVAKDKPIKFQDLFNMRFKPSLHEGIWRIPDTDLEVTEFSERNVLESDLDGVLILHLERYKAVPETDSEGNFKRNAQGDVVSKSLKVDNTIEYSVDHIVDLSAGFGEPAGTRLGELTSFVVHDGSSAHGGHYRAYVKEGDQWFHCNDETKKPVSLDEVKKQMAVAYIVMCKRVIPKP